MPTPTRPPRRTVTRRMVRRRTLTDATPPETPVAQPSLRRPVALVLCAVVLGGLAVWFAQQAHQVRAAAGTNTALTDNAATSEANGQVANAVNTLFSYNYHDLDKTQQAARRLLTGKAVCQYDQLFSVVRQHAP